MLGDILLIRNSFLIDETHAQEVKEEGGDDACNPVTDHTSETDTPTYVAGSSTCTPMRFSTTDHFAT